MAEPLSIVMLVASVFLTRPSSLPFLLEIGSLLGIIAVQLAFWTRTQPVNRYWLEQTRTNESARIFFGSARDGEARPDWTVLRDRWESSHLWRAILAMDAFVLLVIALTIQTGQS